jgi:molybdate transport system permease protein
VTTQTTASARPPARSSSARGGRLEASGSVTAFAVAAAAVLGLPVAALLARSLLDGSLAAVAGMRVVMDALALSLTTTAISLVLMVALGTPLALLLARRRFRGALLLETVIDLPIVLPPSVAGLALLLLLGRSGLLGGPLRALGVELPFTTAAVVVAQWFVAAPFFIRSARTGFAAVDHDLEDAARVDGASERQLFLHVTVPLAGSALTAGLVMAWARALGEFGATIMFAGNVEGHTQTLPLVVYGEFQAGSLDTSVAAASMLVLAAFGVLVAVRLLHWGRVLDLRSTPGS